MTLQAVINASGAGNHVVVAGDANKPTIQVMGYIFQCNVATTLTIKGGTTALTGSMAFTGGGGLNVPVNGLVPFTVDNGDDLIFNLAGLTGQVGGVIWYNQI